MRFLLTKHNIHLQTHNIRDKNRQSRLCEWGTHTTRTYESHLFMVTAKHPPFHVYKRACICVCVCVHKTNDARPAYTYTHTQTHSPKLTIKKNQ